MGFASEVSAMELYFDLSKKNETGEVKIGIQRGKRGSLITPAVFFLGGRVEEEENAWG